MFLPSSVHAQEDDPVPATECCLTMLLPIGARTIGLGQAITARSGSDGAFVNPAALIEVERTQLVVHRSDIGEDKMTTFSLLMHSKLGMRFGFTYQLLDFGETQALDPNGNPIGTITDIAQVVLGSFAATISDQLSAGINYRLYNFSESCTGSVCSGAEVGGTTHMVDVGMRYQPRFLPQLVIGASVMHAGFPLQVKNAAQSDVTPARLRLGGAYDAGRLITSDSTIAVWVHLDLVGKVRDFSTPAMNFGTEVVLDNTIYFRAGHASDGDGITSGGDAVGLGLKYQRFDVNVAKSVTASPVFGGEPFYISFAVTF